MTRAARGAAVAVVALGATLGASRARADLATDVDAVASRYRAAGTVVRLAPRFLSAGSAAGLAVPPEATDPRGALCATVTVMGAPSSAFALRVSGDDADGTAGEGEVVGSVAGVAELTRCGSGRAGLASLSVEVRSPHAVLETLIATSPSPLPPVRRILPHRDPGGMPLVGRPGPPPGPAPLTQRAEAMEQRFRRDGATDVERRFVTTDRSGSGRVLLELPTGCHRIAVLGVPSDPKDTAVHDVDAELRWVSGGIAATDRAESPDASLTACTGQKELAVLAFAGSAGETPLLVVRARSDLPDSLPERWGPEPRARLAKTFLERRLPSPKGAPIHEWLGIGGTTVLPIEVVAGECYVVAVAAVQGNPRLIALTASSSGVERSEAHTGEPSEGAAAAFCAGPSSRAELRIDAHGGSPIWIAALWAVARRPLGEESQ